MSSDQKVWNILVNLIITMDVYIERAEQAQRVAFREDLHNVAMYNKGKTAAYQNIAKWARGKMVEELKPSDSDLLERSRI